MVCLVAFKVAETSRNCYFFLLLVRQGVLCARRIWRRAVCTNISLQVAALLKATAGADNDFQLGSLSEQLSALTAQVQQVKRLLKSQQ